MRNRTVSDLALNLDSAGTASTTAGCLKLSLVCQDCSSVHTSSHQMPLPAPLALVQHPTRVKPATAE